ncbi:DUF6946 family protein [Mycoplana dimorpha]|uniref:DUF6946 domain-containing protein n=1 Tax=Mycoplana dimorpha TaxID=28320 RepID=A0A2T5B5Y0_MYCDI|nr:hypothetical protein [Mycoplana dimorpha]PTM94401.1 hypothetical protein C7449_105303 [Mycoplana dimorpha]
MAALPARPDGRHPKRSFRVIEQFAPEFHLNRSLAVKRKIYLPSPGPAAWQQFLAEPEKQWRLGYSARTLAHCWEDSDGLPPEIAALLIAVPEHKVPLPGGSRDSQNDVFALVRFDGLTCASTIEGKVGEPFGPTVGEWFKSPSEGKVTRMRHICELLGLSDVPPADIRYQLLHRSASALIEAKRFKTDEAAMIVHSFSPTNAWFDDFVSFADLFGVRPEIGKPNEIVLRSGVRFRIGWAPGNPAYLSV